MIKKINVTVCAFVLGLAILGCSGPKLDLESDSTYRKSLAGLRSSLNSDEEREAISKALKQLRAWRTREHAELMKQENLNPEQEERLREFELEHDVKVYEMLHGKNADGIADQYRQMVLSDLRLWNSSTAERVKSLEAIKLIDVKLVELPDYLPLVPGRPVVNGRYLTARTVKIELHNKSQRSISRDSFVSIECVCSASECGREAAVDFVALSLEQGLGSGEQLTIEDRDMATREDDEGLTGVAPDVLKCKFNSLELAARNYGGETELFILLDSPDHQILGLEEKIAGRRQEIERIEAKSFTVSDVVGHIKEVERELEELKKKMNAR